jgi:hypothetical protein
MTLTKLIPNCRVLYHEYRELISSWNWFLVGNSSFLNRNIGITG